MENLIHTIKGLQAVVNELIILGLGIGTLVTVIKLVINELKK